MTENIERRCRYFTSYSGLRLPLNLVNPIAPAALANRNTYIRAAYDENERLIGFKKFVYGEVELAHRYRYDDNGALAAAEIVVPGEDTVVLHFDENGRMHRHPRASSLGASQAGHSED